MPKFILDHGTRDAAKQLHKLDSFTQGYIEAMFFTNTGTEHAALADLAPKTWKTIIADCATFQKANRADIDKACRIDGYDETRAGHDFWYTRCGHGTGYWDRDLGDVGDRLSDAARREGNVDLYRGDNELIYM